MQNFQLKKQKQRTSYEFYIPKGILKRHWMNKHLYRLPALVVVFYDLDWNDPQWKEKQTECASKVAVVRSSLQGRNTKIAVVLIQENMPLPPGEDPQAAQRAKALCQACEFQSDSLFVLPFSDHLQGYVTRLEAAFYEIVQSFYSEKAKFVKQHKELLNKSQHQLLYIRHQFKVAFFSELKQDISLALKHFKQSYQYLLEVKLTVVNHLELKLIAGFINYKICRISFLLNAPLDAISQFRKHIEYFKYSVGSNELLFEHSSWMAKQFSLFGDLFQNAIKKGLQAIQTQHPGFYYQQAANHTMIRRKHCITLCKFSESVTSNPLTDTDSLEFYGQRPWRQHCQANEVPDPSMEQIGILSLQAQELTVEHCWIVIPLLSSAVAQFREYKSDRMKLYLMVQMGEEYFNAKDYGKTLTLLNRVMPYYRSERWWMLLNSVLTTALRCAYVTASRQEYISICLELIGKHCTVSVDEKTRIQMNLLRVIKNSLPEAETQYNEASIESAKELWSKLLQDSNDQQDVMYIDMENLASFVECRASFTADTFHLDETAGVTVYLRSIGAYPIRFSELGICFNNNLYNSKCIKVDSTENSTTPPTNPSDNTDLYLEPNKVMCHAFHFTLLPQDTNQRLEIKQVYLRLGSTTILRWKGAGLDGNISPSFDSSNYGVERLPIKYSSKANMIWESVTISPFADVLPRDANLVLTIEHNAPSLIDEFYPFTIYIDNKENNKIYNTQLTLKIDNPSEVEKPNALLYLDEADGGDDIAGLNQIEFDLQEIEANTKIKKVIYLRSYKVGKKSVVFKVTYNMPVTVGADETVINCVSNKEETIDIETELPFSVSVKIANMKFQQIPKIHLDEPFTIMTYIKCISPWPIEIITTEFNLSNDFKSVDEKLYSQVEGIELKISELAGECQCLVVPNLSTQDDLNVTEKSVSIGSYFIHWRRCNGGKETQSKVHLPLSTIGFVPFHIKTEMPPIGCVEEPMIMRYTILNRTNFVQEVYVSMEASEDFMLAGNSQAQFRILPKDEHGLTYSLYPLHCGEISLPKFRVKFPQHRNLNSDEITDRMLPTHVFVKPRPISNQFKEIQVI